MGTPAAASGKGQSFLLLAGGRVGGQPAQPGSRAPRSGSRELSPAERGPGEGALWVPRYLENTLRAVGGLPRAASRNLRGRSRKDPPLCSATASSLAPTPSPPPPPPPSFLPFLFHRFAAPSESQRPSRSRPSSRLPACGRPLVAAQRARARP